MSAFREAMHAGHSARQRAIAERSPSELLPGWKKYEFSSEKCFFCHTHGQDLRTGYLPIDGAIWQCANCRWEYQAEKAWQSKNLLFRP
jgi:hypothetical protein